MKKVIEDEKSCKEYCWLSMTSQVQSGRSKRVKVDQQKVNGLEPNLAVIWAIEDGLLNHSERPWVDIDGHSTKGPDEFKDKSVKVDGP